MFLLAVIVGSVVTGLLVVALKGADKSRRAVADTPAARDAVAA